MLRYAIVGTNWLSHIYYHAIEAAGDRVAAVCSRSRERAAELGQGKALVYTELDEMLKNPDIDVVYLCIPNVLRCAACGQASTCCAKSPPPSAPLRWRRSSIQRGPKGASLPRR